MGVARREIAIRMRDARILLHREEQLRHRLIEATSEEMRATYYRERVPDAGAGTKPQCGFCMLDRDVGLARPVPERSADGPATSIAWVERQGTVDQRHHGVDVLAEIAQREV